MTFPYQRKNTMCKSEHCMQYSLGLAFNRKILPVQRGRKGSKVPTEICQTQRRATILWSLTEVDWILLFCNDRVKMQTYVIEPYFYEY